MRTVAHGAIDLSAFGTTDATIITITQTKPRYHFTSQLLPIQNFLVRTGQLGGLEAMPAELAGRMTPLTNSVSTFDIGEVGPKAQVNINGSVGSMSVSSIDLGPIGHVSIAAGINAATPTPLTNPGSFTHRC